MIDRSIDRSYQSQLSKYIELHVNVDPDLAIFLTTPKKYAKIYIGTNHFHPKSELSRYLINSFSDFLKQKQVQLVIYAIIS